MHKLEDAKYEQINNILIIVKLSALLFCGIICFKYLSNTTLQFVAITSTVAIVLAVLCLMGIFLIWNIVVINRLGISTEKYVQVFENIIFMAIFLVMILISGKHESPNKFLFLFIITTSTIQCGMKYGISIAGVSSVMILVIDLICLPNSKVNPYFEDDLVLVGIFMLIAWILGYYVKLETEHIEELKNMVNRDGLTGVYNHRYFHDTLGEKIKDATDRNEPISLLYIDIDNFKYYNDLNGHQKGDEVLKAIGQLLSQSVRAIDIVARYGGEEFVVILPGADKQEGLSIAEKIRQTVESTYIISQENQPTGNLTVSVGLATYPDNAKDDTELIKSADDALYRAKFFNKNRVEVYASVLDEIKKEINESENELVTSIKTLISVINAKDRYTYGHSERVVMFSRMLADKLELSEREKKDLVYGAYMHDIGKINIPVDILNKKMPLTKEEWERLKQHPDQGAEIIRTVESLQSIIPLIRHHHEKYDGTGYPAGLKGEEIPYLARVLTVIDSFDAMTSNRPYNKHKTYEEGFTELRKFSGIQFDPDIVEVFIETISENKEQLQ